MINLLNSSLRRAGCAATAALASLGLLCMSCAAQAAPVNEWQISSASTWTLRENAFYDIGKDSASRYMSLHETVQHRELRYRVPRNVVFSYSFGVGCVMQSKVPSFILRTSTLDIPMISSHNGYVFARFVVDKREEASMRGEILSPGRIVFMPYTKSQEQKLSDMFLQLNEGGRLRIALLRGKNDDPILYTIPLIGFKELSGQVVEDCQRLNQLAGSGGYLPEYVTNEPRGLAPSGFKIGRKPAAGGEYKDAHDDGEEGDEEAALTAGEPQVHDFRPDGSMTSIGPDGLPVGADASSSSQELAPAGSAGPMQIDGEGNPIF